jgi:hypothetical protein
MIYIKVKDGIVEKYPYSVEELKAENKDVSFPAQVSLETLAEFGVFPLLRLAKPEIDHTKNVNEDTPKFVNDKWVQVWEVTAASNDEILQRVLKLRASKYPPMTDYLDGIVKGDQAQIDKYIADCLAVKAKYPKPTQG